MRASRLLSILLLLQHRGRLSATTLAELLDVSVRTVHRDVEQLSGAGVPVYGSRGRHGGFELLDGWRTNLTGLTDAEAEALFLAGVPGPARALGLGGALDTAQLKLLAALPSDSDVDPMRVRARFHLDPVSWFASNETVPHLTAIGQAAWGDEKIRIRYESWTDTSYRVVSPLGIVLKAGTWYLVAISRGKTRTFRLSKVHEAMPTGNRFDRPPEFDLATFWADNSGRYERSRYIANATIRINAVGLALLRRSSNIVATAIADADVRPDDDGWTRITIPIESIGHGATEMMGLGDNVEVLSPPELRQQLRSITQRLVQMYCDS